MITLVAIPTHAPVSVSPPLSEVGNSVVVVVVSDDEASPFFTVTATIRGTIPKTFRRINYTHTGLQLGHAILFVPRILSLPRGAYNVVCTHTHALTHYYDTTFVTIKVTLAGSSMTCIFPASVNTASTFTVVKPATCIIP